MSNHLQSLNDQNSNFSSIWATEMTKNKKWYYSSPEVHLYYQQNDLHIGLLVVASR